MARTASSNSRALSGEPPANRFTTPVALTRPIHSANSGRPALAASIRANAAAHLRASSAASGRTVTGPVKVITASASPPEWTPERRNSASSSPSGTLRPRAVRGGRPNSRATASRSAMVAERRAIVPSTDWPSSSRRRTRSKHPRERGIAEQPVQSLVIDVSHSGRPSGGGAALINGDSGADSTRMRSAPSHSQRLTRTAATPSTRESCAIASPGTSA